MQFEESTPEEHREDMGANDPAAGRPGCCLSRSARASECVFQLRSRERPFGSSLMKRRLYALLKKRFDVLGWTPDHCTPVSHDDRSL